MPRYQMKAGADTSSTRVSQFDRLELKSNQEARLWFPDEEFAFMEYVHTLKKPTFEESGKPVMTVKQVRGGDKEVYETYFIGRRICSGDPDVLDTSKPDPENCVVCAVVKKLIDAGIEEATDLLAQRRYAVPVIRYKIRDDYNGEFEVRKNPPQADLLVWSFAPGTYRKIESVRGDAAELLSTDERSLTAADIKLQMVDICVHCDSGSYKTLGKISVKRRAWAGPANAEVKAVVSALWNDESNRPTDVQMRASLGRDPDPRWGKEDADDAADNYFKAANWKNGGGSVQVSGRSGLEGDLDDLLDEGPAKPAAEAHPGGLDEFAGKAPAEVSDDLLDDIAPAPAAAPAAKAPAAPSGDDDPFADDAPAPAAAKVPVTSGAPADSDTFDELLAD
jgi:hypothetical protein